MTTIKEIARVLNISESTVSRALSGKLNVNAQTRQRIIETARDMNYFSDKPSSILLDNSNTVGLIIPEINANFYVQLISEIENHLRDKDTSILLGLSRFEDDIAIHYLRLFASKRVNGIICEHSLFPEFMNELYFIFERYHIPILLIGEPSDMECNNFDTIFIDERIGISLAFEHLISLGHKKIAIVGDMKSKSRLSAFKKCCEKYHFDYPEIYANVGIERFELGGYLRTKEVLACNDRPTAIIATYDACALGAMRAIQEAGLCIPDDISIIGVDNGRELPYYNIALTSIKRISDGLGDSAIQILMGKIKNRDSKLIQHLKILPELIIRESTGPAPKTV